MYLVWSGLCGKSGPLRLGSWSPCIVLVWLQNLQLVGHCPKLSDGRSSMNPTPLGQRSTSGLLLFTSFHIVASRIIPYRRPVDCDEECHDNASLVYLSTEHETQAERSTTTA